MKTSCVAHPKSDVMLVLRRWQVDACEGNHCAAALLAFFEYWHNIKLDQQGQAEKANRIAEMHGDAPTQTTSLLQFHNTEELQAGILDLYGESRIEKTLPFLVEKGFISVHKNPNPRYHFDKTRHFLFHPDTVNDYLDSVQSRNPSRKNTAPSRKNTAPSRKNTAAIPEITSEITPEIFPPSPPTEEPSPVTLTPDWLMRLYNQATPPEHPKVRTLSPARRAKATKYVRIFPDAPFWQTVMQEVSDSAFLLGRKPSEGHEGFVADFDWLLTKGKDGTENCLKVAEGKYRDGPLDGFSPAQRRTILAAQRAWHKEQDGDASGAVSDVFDIARNARRRLRGPSGGDPPEGVLGTDA